MLVNGRQGDSVSTNDQGLLYGNRVLRTIRTSKGHIPHWPLHCQKLQRNAGPDISCLDFASHSAGKLFVVNTAIVLGPVREQEKGRWTGFAVTARIRQCLDEQDAG
jgi:hypothetical protein